MPGSIVTGVHVNKLFILRDTTLTAVTVFYLFLFVRLVIHSSILSTLSPYRTDMSRSFISVGLCLVSPVYHQATSDPENFAR